MCKQKNNGCCHQMLCIRYNNGDSMDLNISGLKYKETLPCHQTLLNHLHGHLRQQTKWMWSFAFPSTMCMYIHPSHLLRLQQITSKILTQICNSSALHWCVLAVLFLIDCRQKSRRHQAEQMMYQTDNSNTIKLKSFQCKVGQWK